MAKKIEKPRERVNLPVHLKTALLTEAGYRCAVPTCRELLVLDMHHIYEWAEGGSDELCNLIALCPTCHSAYHRGLIRPESIWAWKSMLIAINRAFDVDAIDKLLFLYKAQTDQLALSGDGVLQFARLIAADLAEFECKANNAWQLVTYVVRLTTKGRRVIEAWRSGDPDILERALTPSPLLDPSVLSTVVTT